MRARAGGKRWAAWAALVLLALVPPATPGLAMEARPRERQRHRAGPEMMEPIFEMFSQADRSLERTTMGLGVGLSLSHRLVELHGGTIEAHSAGPGKGSEFTVRMPARIAAQGQAARAGVGSVVP